MDCLHSLTHNFCILMWFYFLFWKCFENCIYSYFCILLSISVCLIPGHRHEAIVTTVDRRDSDLSKLISVIFMPEWIWNMQICVFGIHMIKVVRKRFNHFYGPISWNPSEEKWKTNKVKTWNLSKKLQHFTGDGKQSYQLYSQYCARLMKT